MNTRSKLKNNCCPVLPLQKRRWLTMLLFLWIYSLEIARKNYTRFFITIYWNYYVAVLQISNRSGLGKAMFFTSPPCAISKASVRPAAAGVSCIMFMICLEIVPMKTKNIPEWRCVTSPTSFSINGTIACSISIAIAFKVTWVAAKKKHHVNWRRGSRRSCDCYRFFGAPGWAELSSADEYTGSID